MFTTTKTMVNIAIKSRLQEPGYRYKREVIKVITESFKGNVTRIINLNNIAKQLQIPFDKLEIALTKYVKKTLGISKLCSSYISWNIYCITI